MDYSEEYRPQLRQGPLLRTLSGAVRPDDMRSVCHFVHQSQGRGALGLLGDGAGLSISEKLRILSGHDYNVHVDADMRRSGTGLDLCDGFASDSPIRKLGRLVLWHCECLYYQLLGQWVGEWVDSLKQKWTRLPDRSCSTAR
jgi:hypothetical protein